MFLRLTTDPNTYAQWAVLKISNNFSTGGIQARNADLLWGKFHEKENKDTELPLESINETFIPSGGSSSISTSGRSMATSVTEGTIDLYDHDRETRICTVFWHCSWESKVNDLEIRNRASKYQVNLGPWNKGGGALGIVDIDVEGIN